MQLPSVFRRLSALAAAALLLNSCAGYHIGSDKPARMETIKKLAVPTFKNLTLEPRSSVLVTNNVIRLFQTDGTYQIVDPQNAEAVLHGTIEKFERRQLRSARNNTLRTRELELRLYVSYTVDDPVSGATLAKGNINGSTSVFLDPNFQLSERQAIDDASSRVAEELVSRLAEGWGSAEFPVVPATDAKPHPTGASKGHKNRGSGGGLQKTLLQ